VRPICAPEYPFDLDDPVAFGDAVEQPPAGDDLPMTPPSAGAP